jgi:hypothetical protein
MSWVGMIEDGSASAEALESPIHGVGEQICFVESVRGVPREILAMP